MIVTTLISILIVLYLLLGLCIAREFIEIRRDKWIGKFLYTITTLLISILWLPLAIIMVTVLAVDHATSDKE
jgi:hypothetical protein